MADFTLGPGNQLEFAARRMAAHVDQIFARRHMAAVTILGQCIYRFWPDHAASLGLLPTYFCFGLGLSLLFLAAVTAVDLNPIFAFRMTGFTGYSGNGLYFGAGHLSGEMAV